MLFRGCRGGGDEIGRLVEVQCMFPQYRHGDGGVLGTRKDTSWLRLIRWYFDWLISRDELNWKLKKWVDRRRVQILVLEEVKRMQEPLVWLPTNIEGTRHI
jgi:hypothetical protein